MEHIKLIAMQKNLGLGHKGDILLTTQERVDANQEPIAKDIIDEEYAQELVRRWNAFEKDGLVDELMETCKETRKLLSDVILPMGAKKQGTPIYNTIKKLEAAIAKVKA